MTSSRPREITPFCSCLLRFPQHALFVLLLAAFGSRAFSSPPYGQWDPIPELSDEFECDSLDAQKWHDHNPQWSGRIPGYFAKNNVGLREGKLRLTARAETLPGLPEGYSGFSTAAVKSKTTVLYGYFEARCRPMRSKVCSAFWFYDTAPQRWTEIDVFEIGGGVPGKERTVHMNAHVFRAPGYEGTIENHLISPDEWEAPGDLADEYRVFALEWDPHYIRWWIDGKLIRSIENTHWHQPLYLNFDCETMPDWLGLPGKDELPATFSIDYIRSWRRVDSNAAKHSDS